MQKLAHLVLLAKAAQPVLAEHRFLGAGMPIGALVTLHTGPFLVEFADLLRGCYTQAIVRNELKMRRVR